VDYQGLRTWRRFGDGPGGPGFQPAGSDLSFYDGEINTLQARVDWQLGRHQSIDAGYEFENENFSSHFLLPDPTQNSQTSVTQRSGSAFVQDQVHLFDGRLQLAGSYRLQPFALENPDFTPAASAPYSGIHFSAPPTAQTGDGSVAWFFRKSGTKIRSHVGRGYRAPSLYERFGVYYSPFGYSAFGDPRLKPERFVSVDGGVDQSFWNARARLSATYFYTQLQSVIAFDTQGIITPAVDPFGRYGGYFSTNGGLARGVELNGSVTATKSTTVNWAYTYTDARERTPLSPGVWRTYRIPENMFSTMVTQRLSARATAIFTVLASGSYLTPIFDSISFQNRAYQFPGMKQGQLSFNYRLPLGEFTAVRFFARADNLWNQRYYESGYRTPGVTGLGGMQFEF
jgi:vitamin B12 transporter